MTYHNDSERSSLDAATSARLRMLAGRPVDTRRLDRRLQEAMRQQRAKPQPVLFLAQWWRPMASLAAAVMIMAVVGWWVLGGGSAVAVASPEAMARIQYDMTHGMTPAMKVTTLAQANAMLARQASDAKAMPADLPGQVQSCCLHQVAGARLSCVLMEHEGQLISVAVADGAKLRAPQGPTVKRHGTTFTLQSAHGINMVMARKEGRWLCVMGAAKMDDLLDVASGIKF